MVHKSIQYFNQLFRYFKRIAGVGSGSFIYFLKSKGLSDQNITASTTSGYRLNPQFSYLDAKTRVEVKRSCLKQHKTTYHHGKTLHCLCDK